MHILIIEDDPLFRREMKDFLENSLYHVTALTEFDCIVPKALSLRPAHVVRPEIQHPRHSQVLHDHSVQPGLAERPYPAGLESSRAVRL